MDPISQGALGAVAALSIWGNDKRLPKGVIAWLGALSAMAPDLDVLIRSSEDSLLAIEYHRHFTHSLSFVPVGATIALLPWLLRRDVRAHLKLAWLVSVVGYLTHAPLDCATTYGTQYFWPFTDYRVSLSWVSVVDPLYTLPLLLFVIVSAVKERATWARVGFAFSLGYLALGAVQKGRALTMQARIIEARGHTATRRDAITTFMNQVTWRSLYEADGRIYVDQIRVPYMGTRCMKEGSSLPLAPKAPTGLGPRATRGHRLIRWFSSDWVAPSPDEPSLLIDMRYSFFAYGTEPFWGVRIDENADTAEWVPTRAERNLSVGAVVDLIFKNPPGSICGK
jgi:inner membrane protein